MPVEPSNTVYSQEFSHEHSQGWPSPRPTKCLRRSSSIDTVPPCPTANTIPIRIGDSEKIRAFYETGFKQFQQAGCRLLAKEWVKCIQPKKQVKHAYKQGEKSKPSWWPRHVIHKEPDHLKTPGKDLADSSAGCSRLIVPSTGGTHDTYPVQSRWHPHSRRTTERLRRRCEKTFPAHCSNWSPE